MATALGVEYAALRSGMRRCPRTVRIVRVGLRARHRRRLTDALPGPATPVVVVGVAGALDPSLRPGDVVVAARVRRAADPARGDPTGGPHCPAAEALAADLRRAGLPVRVGTLLEADRVIDGKARADLARSGALAVDMESRRLLDAVHGHPCAVVRVIADTPHHPLWHPAIIPAGTTALRTLSRIVPHLADWGESLLAHRISTAKGHPTERAVPTGQPLPARPRDAAAQNRSATTASSSGRGETAAAKPSGDGSTIGYAPLKEARFE